MDWQSDRRMCEVASATGEGLAYAAGDAAAWDSAVQVEGEGEGLRDAGPR